MRDILLFLVVVASIPCVAQTDEEYTIDSCPDTTKACVIAYHSNDGTEFNGRTSYSYYDHFGRLEEVLDLGITPNGRDLVALTEYDGFGRQKRQWLQAISLMPDHKYVEENIVRAMSCLTNGNNVPYTRTEYEETPLARPLRVTGAGAAWHSAGKGVNSSYLTNNQTDDSLICWKYVATQNTTNSMTVILQELFKLSEKKMRMAIPFSNSMTVKSMSYYPVCYFRNLTVQHTLTHIISTTVSDCYDVSFRQRPFLLEWVL